MLTGHPVFWLGNPTCRQNSMTESGSLCFDRCIGDEHTYVCAKSLYSCLTLCDPRDSSPPDFSVHGTLQARILKQVAISYSRELS